MSALPVRRLGPLAVSAVGLGCMNLSHAYGETPTEAQGIGLIHRALDLGVTMLDTAALYGGGRNEELVGAAIQSRRDDVILASKCVLGMSGGKRVLDGSPASIASSIDSSLRRLGVDHIDLLYLHRIDPAVPVEESVGALVRALDAGKIGAIGLSEASADTIRRAHAVHPVTAVQSEYAPWVRNPEVAVLAACRDLGIGFVAFSPLGRGFLAGSVRARDFTAGDIRLAMPRFGSPHLERNFAVLDRFVALAHEAGCSPAQLSLAWLLSREPYIVPIPGTRNIAHLEENVAACSLAAETHILDAVDEIFAPGAVSGARYSAAMQAQIDTELLPDEELSHV